MLILPIKKKWFDMILSGEKKEEYREVKPYYEARFRIFEDKAERIIMFRNGYGKGSPSFIAKCTLSIGKGKEEWGAEKGKQYFVLAVREIWRERIEGMNQQPRYIKMTCCKCKDESVFVRQVYNPHISNWEICKIPICFKCKKDEDRRIWK